MCSQTGEFNFLAKLICHLFPFFRQIPWQSMFGWTTYKEDWENEKFFEKLSALLLMNYFDFDIWFLCCWMKRNVFVIKWSLLRFRYLVSKLLYEEKYVCYKMVISLFHWGLLNPIKSIATDLGSKHLFQQDLEFSTI